MSKSEVRLRFGLGEAYNKQPPEVKYEMISAMLNSTYRRPKAEKECLLGELRRVEKALGWPHRRYNSPDRGELPPVGQ